MPFKDIDMVRPVGGALWCCFLWVPLPTAAGQEEEVAGFQHNVNKTHKVTTSQGKKLIYVFR